MPYEDWNHVFDICENMITDVIKTSWLAKVRPQTRITWVGTQGGITAPISFLEQCSTILCQAMAKIGATCLNGLLL